MTEITKPGALSLVAKALGALFNNPETPFITTKARNILFDGITINCTSNDFAPKAVCSQIKANPKGLVKQDENIYLFSLFGAVSFLYILLNFLNIIIINT